MSLIKVKNLIDEDFVQYKIPSMFIGFSRCSFKCGFSECQNSALATAPDIYANTETIAKRYMNNNISHAIVMGGLDPMDTPKQCWQLCRDLRKVTTDPIVIYTGYTEEECVSLNNRFVYWGKIVQYPNIIFKYGRYIPNSQSYFNDTLGVKLASNNQYTRTYNLEEKYK